MIELLNYTERPLNTIGEIAGICWNSPTDNIDKNVKRAKSCIKSGHDRVMEYPDITVIISGYSARCIRELGRHIIGTTYLQESTRYVNYDNFDYYEPNSILKVKTNDKEVKAEKEYVFEMNTIAQSYKTLLECDIPKEDAANILPLGMNTKIIWKINLRALVHFMNMRLCSRALMEIRQLSNELKGKLSSINDEWKWICDELLVPKCKIIGYCQEEKCCGLMPKGLDGLKEKIIEEYEENKLLSLENDNNKEIDLNKYKDF